MFKAPKGRTEKPEVDEQIDRLSWQLLYHTDKSKKGVIEHLYEALQQSQFKCVNEHQNMEIMAFALGTRCENMTRRGEHLYLI